MDEGKMCGKNVGHVENSELNKLLKLSSTSVENHGF